MRKVYGFLLFSCTLYTVHSSTVFAASPSPAASESSSIRQKLDALRQEIASKAAQFKIDVNKKLQNKFLVGNIDTKETGNLVISTNEGKKEVIVNEYTLYDNKLGKPKSKATIKDILKDDYIAALGDIDEKGVMTAKKIVKFKKISLDKKSFFGVVQNVLVGTIEIKNKEGKIEKISTDNQTVFVINNKEAVLANIKPGFLLAGLSATASANLKAKFIYAVSKEVETKTATPTATLKSSSPSATPKKSP